MSRYLDKVELLKSDSNQYEAYSSDQNTVVLAGPGSGKTTVLTLKIMKLLQENIRAPRGLACMTFSNEAAREFKKRLYELGVRNRTNVFLGTVHSFCIAEIIHPFAHLYPQYNFPLPLKIISQKYRNRLFRQVLIDLELDEKSLNIIDMDNERTKNISGFSQVTIPSFDLALRVAVEYEKRLYKYGYMDFVSIVKFATVLIQNEPYVRKCLEAKFPWICVDEYQDLGRPLHEMILSLLRSTDIQFFVVGDPDQSIYGFGGAIPDYLLELYKEPGVVRVQLQKNYRSNQDIIDASEVALAAERPRNYVAGTRHGERAKFFFHRCSAEMHEQYDFVVNKIIPSCQSDDISLEEIAVLVRTNQELRDLSEVLNNAGIPYYVSKQNFERSHVVIWLEECAQWLQNSSNITFESLYSFWRLVKIRHGKLISRRNDIQEKRELYFILLNSRQHGEHLSDWLKYIMEKLYLNELFRNSNIYPDEISNLLNLVQVSEDGVFAQFGIEKFSKLGKPENQVTVSTRHASKGLEFEAVILLGMEEGSFPSYRSTGNARKLAEEHRIFFVCISRAKSRCYLVRSQRLNGYLKSDSRFWKALEEWYLTRQQYVEN